MKYIIMERTEEAEYMRILYISANKKATLHAFAAFQAAGQDCIIFTNEVYQIGVKSLLCLVQPKVNVHLKQVSAPKYVVVSPDRDGYCVLGTSQDTIAKALLLRAEMQKFGYPRSAVYIDDARVCENNKFISKEECIKLTKWSGG